MTKYIIFMEGGGWSLLLAECVEEELIILKIFFLPSSRTKELERIRQCRLNMLCVVETHRTT